MTSAFQSACLPIVCDDTSLWLHPERVLYRPDSRTLFVADLHAGKEAVFGRHGIAIPGGGSEQDLQRLFALLRASGAERLVVLGDFMHAVPEFDEHWLSLFGTLLDSHANVHVEIVAGNHDHDAGQSRIDARVHWHRNALFESPFVLQHVPGQDSRGRILCGHLHPGLHLGRARRAGVMVPVFYLGKATLVLPAFGSFTGLAGVRMFDGDRAFVCGPERVVEATPTIHA